MKRGVERILTECIDAVLKGGLSPEEALARHPQHRKELEPLLSTALDIASALGGPVEVKPSFAFKVSTRAILNRAMAERQSAGITGLLANMGPFGARLYGPVDLTQRGLKGVMEGVTALGRGKVRVVSTRVATAALSAFLALTVASAGSVYAARYTVPGDLLYPVKTAGERARLALAFSEEERSGVYIDIAESRLGELSRVAKEGRGETARALAAEYGQSVGQALEQAKKADTGLSLLRTQEQLAKHVEVLQDLSQAVPQQAQGAIELALVASLRGALDATQKQALRQAQDSALRGALDTTPRHPPQAGQQPGGESAAPGSPALPATTDPKPNDNKTAEQPGGGTAPGKGDGPQPEPTPVKGMPGAAAPSDDQPNKEGTTPDISEPVPVAAKEGPATAPATGSGLGGDKELAPSSTSGGSGQSSTQGGSDKPVSINRSGGPGR